LHAYRGTPVKLEAVLANEDALPPGEYPVRLAVVGSNMQRVFERVVTVTIPSGENATEAAFAVPIFDETVTLDVPHGEYRFLATMERGGAPAGGETVFFVADPAKMPDIQTEVVLWGDDTELKQWLNTHRIRSRPFATEPSTARELILVGTTPAPGGAEAWQDLVRHTACGASVVFLSPHVFRHENDPTRWLPLQNKGTLPALRVWLYHKDDWAKHHPVFAGLPSGGMLDYAFYREIIPDGAFVGQDPPEQAIAGANDVSFDYASGLTVAEYRLGAGRLLLNTLLIRERLGTDPLAERLLRNMLQYAGRDLTGPATAVPAEFDQMLKELGY
jgi:hypothetical protein